MKKDDLIGWEKGNERRIWYVEEKKKTQILPTSDSVADRRSLPLILLNCNTLQIINTQTQPHTQTLIHGTLNPPPKQCDDSKAKKKTQNKQCSNTKNKKITTQQNVRVRCRLCGGGARLFTHVSYMCILTISKFKAQVAWLCVCVWWWVLERNGRLHDHKNNPEWTRSEERITKHMFLPPPPPPGVS